jgi:hypothetical protein
MKALLSSKRISIALTVFAVAVLSPAVFSDDDDDRDGRDRPHLSGDDVKDAFKHDRTIRNSVEMVFQGRNIFRYDTYGDEAFWGDTLQLYQALNQLTPRQALALGLKIDAEALSDHLQEKIRKGKIDLDDPGVTLALIRRKAVLGVVGFFDDDKKLRSVGLTCAVCHSTVNDSVAPGVGERLDGWANHDLNAGAIIAAAPNIKPLTDLLKIVHPTITDDQVRAVLNTWGPGKFDAELILDGKAFQPDGRSAGDAHSKRVRPRRTQSPYLDRWLGHGDLLECVRRQSGTSWRGKLF